MLSLHPKIFGITFLLSALAATHVPAHVPRRDAFLINASSKPHVILSISTSTPVRISWTDPETSELTTRVYTHPFYHVIDGHQTVMLEQAMPIPGDPIESFYFNLVTDPDTGSPKLRRFGLHPTCTFNVRGEEERYPNGEAWFFVPSDATAFQGSERKAGRCTPSQMSRPARPGAPSVMTWQRSGLDRICEEWISGAST